MKAHVCVPGVCLPLCKHKQAGTGGMGRPKANPSKPGRTVREHIYMVEHPDCECTGCPECSHPPEAPFQPPCWRRSTDCDHIGGRGLGGHKRNTARLQAKCHPCHMYDPHGNKAVKPQESSNG